MSLEPGTRIGPYRIVAAIGAGGMGEVYRATDTKLGRDVAIKVLPDSVAGDADRRARFEREAQALAALNHFNIAQVYGLEGDAIVMELLEGETLRDRLKAGAIPMRKAIEYGAAIARGLAAAHDRGVIHRDLKPENVFILNDGHIKILDFGLARQDEPVSSDHDTVTARHGTAPGVVMGTAGYMSPEQVRGSRVEARSDLFSLGAVLYEMLSGQRAFQRDSSVETMSAILNDAPKELASIKPDVNPAVDRIVQHCLEKNPVERFQSARDVAFALESFSGSSTAIAGPAPERSIVPERALWIATTIALLLSAGWLWMNRSPRLSPATPATTGLIVLPEGVMLNESASPGAKIALSPDGSGIVFHGRYLSDGHTQMFLQRLDGSPAAPLQDTRNVQSFFWTRDSRAVMAFTPEALLRFPLDGSKPVTINSDLKNIFTGGAINADGDVLAGGNTLRLLHASTGVVEVIRQEPQVLYVLPQFFEDGRRFLYGRASSSGDVSVMISTLGSTDSTALMNGADIRKTIPVNGALIFAKGGTLFAQRMTDSPPALTGEPVVIAQSLDTQSGRGQAVTVSSNGLVAFLGETARALFRLTWYDRRGTVLTTIGDDANYSNLELSPDGRQLLVSATEARSENRDIYIVDVNRGVRRRFTSDPSDERSAIWSPDGSRVLYTSRNLNFFIRSADSSGPERELFAEPSNKDPYDWSQDGRLLLYRRLGAVGNDLWIMPSNGPGPGRPVADSRFNESSGNFSPDGRYIVYASDESGQTDVYVVNTNGGGKTQISTNGGLFPRWSRDGKQIFYISIDRMLTSVDVRSGSTLQVSAPHPLFPISVVPLGGAVYDVSPDGQRFIVATPVPPRVPPALTIVTNWQQLLK